MHMSSDPFARRAASGIPGEQIALKEKRSDFGTRATTEGQDAAPNAAQRQDASCEKSPFARTGLQKEKQARFPVPATCNLAEEGGGFRIALRALHLVG